MTKKLISTQEAARRLGISRRRVQQLVAEGRLPAAKVGGVYVIEEADLDLVRERKPGWPKGRPRKGEGKGKAK